VLVRNEHYWGGMPAWDKVTIRAIKNDASRVAALLAHDVDFIEAVPPADFPRLQANADVVAVAFPGARTPYIAMDQRREQSPDITDKKGMPIRNPFLDWRVRKAMDLAIDRNAIVARVFDGLADKTSQVEPPGQIAHSDALDASPLYTEYNPEKARALLADAGYAGGFKVKLNTPDTGYLGASAYVQALGQMFSRIGIDTEVNVLPRSVFVKSWFAGEYGFAINSYGGTNLEPDRSILAVLHSKSEGGDGGVQNGGRFVNPKIDFYYLLGSREMDRDLRVAYYRAAQEAAVQDVNLIMTHRPRLLWGMRKGLQFRQYPAEEYFRLNEIRATN
jgi:peptide/nickel transport system substrate-binding protein